MNRIPHLSSPAVYRSALFLGLCAWALCAPAFVRADDPVEALRDVLKINSEGDIRLQERLRPEKVAKAMAELKTITQLRRAFFLKEWPRPEAPDPAIDVGKYRKAIGTALLAGIRQAALEPNVDRQIAAVMLVAELADADQPSDRSPTGKFASGFTDLLIGGGKAGKGLIKSDNVILRQAALHALGKITPKPAEVFPPAGQYRPFDAALKDAAVGPRRLAAYALSDLIKNEHYLDVTDELKTNADAVKTAIAILSKPNEDEIVRGYAFQAIQASAVIFTDYPVSPGTAIHFDAQGEGKVLNPNVAAIMKTYQQASPRLVAALKDDPSAAIRLTAMEALEQIAGARTKIMEKFTEMQKDLPADKRAKRADIFAAFKSPDPLSYLFQIDKTAPAALKWNWEVVPAHLQKDESARMRRGAMAFLELVADDVDAAIETSTFDKNTKLAMRRRFVNWLTLPLRDPDNIVRWSAARTVRRVSLDALNGDIVEALGEMLIDPAENDVDPSAAAAVTLQTISASPYASRSIRYLKSVIADPEKDVELREQAVTTLVMIGGPDANSAFPELTSILTDRDVRIRRAAAQALGQLGRPATRQIGEAALMALRHSLVDEDGQVRQNASEALLSIVLPR